MSARFFRKWERAEAHFSGGRLDAAQVVCESLLSDFPDYNAAHWMLSRISQARTRFRSANHHARLAAINMEQLPFQQQLAVSRSLISVGEYEAATSFLRATPPNIAIDQTLLSEAIEQLSMLDDHECASVWLEFAEKNNIRSAQLSSLRGKNLKFSGDIEEAALAFEEAILFDPGDVHIHHLVASLSMTAGAGVRVDRLRNLVTSLRHHLPTTPSREGRMSDLAILYYALFKEFNLLGDTESAWGALAQAMHYKRSLTGHDRVAEDSMFDRLIETYDKHFLSGCRERVDGNIPVFIMGMPRTGTTLIERVLGNHPQLTACGELSELRMRYKWASDYYCSGFLDHEAAARMADIDVSAFGKEYLERTDWRTNGRRLFTDKHPGNFLLSGLVLKALPQAKIIHVRRNSMDTCFSNLKELFAPHYYEYSYDIGDVANHYRNYARLMNHISKAMPDRILEVQYEEFVADPGTHTARILRFIGLPLQEGITDIARNKLPVSTASSVQVRKPIHTKQIDAWKLYQKYLGPLQDQLS